MKRFSLLLIALLLVSSACEKGPEYALTNQSYEVLPPAEDSTRPIVKMNSVLDENLHFKFAYDPEFWELKAVEPGTYPTNVILSHTWYKNDSCVIMPGTVGGLLEKNYDIEQWAYQSEKTYGIDYQFMNPVTGITEMRVFEADSNGQGFPTTLFELRLPTDGQDQYQCYEGWQQLIGTYEFDFYSGTPEQLQAKMAELELTKQAQEDALKKAEQEALIKALEEEKSATGEVESATGA